MWKGLAALAVLLILGACEGAHRQVASCATATAGAPTTGYTGPCHDSTDRTDRTNRDDIVDRTDRTNRDDIADRTDRTNRDDITDRTVWCVEPGWPELIQARSSPTVLDAEIVTGGIVATELTRI